MSGYIGSKTSVTQVDGYNRTEADAEFVQDPNGAITVSGLNVGIGTSSPSGAKLQVTGSNYNDQLVIERTDTSSKWGLAGADSGGFQIYDVNSSNATRMAIDSSGNLLVGTTSANGTEILQLAAGGVQWSTGPNATNGSFDVLNAAGTGVYLANGSTSWAGLSDERFKDIIEPITNASDKVSTLRPIIGKYKTDKADVRRSFLIAQDVQAVFPEAVDAQDENKLGLRYGDMVPLLTAALQEALTKIDDMETRLAALEGN